MSFDRLWLLLETGWMYIFMAILWLRFQWKRLLRSMDEQ